MSTNSQTAPDERDRSYLARIARLYYLEDLSQQHIARRLKISIATVSRALRRARVLGIVTIRIDETFEGAGELETALERRWDLEECVVVPEFDTLERTYQHMANAMTDILRRLVHSNDTVGVSWGVTLKTIGENLGSIKGHEVKVIPIIGAMGEVDTGIYPNSIAREFAAHLSGTAYMVNIPAVVDDQSIRDSMVRDSHYRSIREMWRGLDIAIMSVSGLDEDTSAYRSGIFSSRELEALRRRGGACATNFTILDSAGRVLDDPIAGRILGIPFSELEAIPQVIVAAAGAKKGDALRAALNAGIVKRLVTDVECATAVLQG